ncbi:pentatricopeptide repeat-containing protein At1g02060, chloroplastic [Raphanus sativus]|uniref:Pentatricopeptide repeat-containing protein At1g02060, chloroplastic n=1 Tax=Raphanus sativus TaxID=3726 RepID=A0A6J0NJC2_RAPSA|nr:pentatricopeptide repeat-containing protein At1g02060, chloroplastic [Raphanus sativus]
MVRGSSLHALFVPKPQRTKSKLATSLARAINSSDQFEPSSLSSLHPPESALSLSTTTVLQTLRLIKPPSHALRFFDWLPTVGFSHNPHSFFLMLHLLSRSRNLNAARNFLFSIEKRSNGSVKLHPRFFNTLITSYADAGLLHESINLFHTMKKMGVSPSAITFNTLLSILLKRGKTGLALDLFHEMRGTYGVKPDSYTYNILINGFCKNSMVSEAFRVFKDMECVPDLVTYNTIIDGLCRAGKVTTAHNVLNGMLKKEVSPNVVTYTTLVRGYCMKHEVDKALALFRELVATRGGVKPNAVTFNTLVKGLSEARRFDDIKEVLRCSSFAPDACTFNVLIKAHCDGGDLDAALEVFREMLPRPDSASYSVLIRALCLRREFGRAERLFEELFEKEVLLEKDGSKPLAAAYNPMFEYLCANGKTKRAEGVFRQLMKIGAQDPVSYRTLIMGHCREGEFKGAYELLVLMLRREFVPDFETYELLTDGLLKTGEAVLAHDTLQRMLRSSYLPVAATFHRVLGELVKGGFASECFELVRIMLEKGIRQSVDLSTDAVRLLFSSGQKDKAFLIVRLIYENGYLVKMEELIDFLCEKRKLVDSAHRLVVFCLEKNQMIDVSRCNRVIEELCKHKRHSEAFGLYNELVEIGKNHQELSCHVVLRNALEAAGKLEEVRFLSKRMAMSDDCYGLKQRISS